MCVPACSGQGVVILSCTGQRGACVSQHALGTGVMYLSMYWAGGCLPGGSAPVNRMTDRQV